MQIKTIGIIGYGAFGALACTLVERFAPEVRVRVHSEHHPADGKKFFSLKDATASDAVVFAIPIAAFESVLRKTLPLMRKDAIIVDVATVKVHTTDLLKRLAKGSRYIAAHPVWGPESYEKRGGDVTAFRIVMTDGTLPAADHAALTKFLKRCGFDVVEMSAEAHDKHLAETLFLTHFIGQTVLKAGFGRTEVDTVSFGFLMDAVESVKNDQALFRDVFRFNPYCKDILDRIKKAETEVRVSLEDAREKKTGIAIGISGAKGSFSEEAARAYAKKSGIKKFTLDYLISVENVLSKLEKGAVDLGIFPIENSTGGVVTEAIQGMAKHNFRIKKLFDIDIKQNLLVRKETTIQSIKVITSHEQALKQCKAYLKREWKHVKVKEYEDTAKAAEDLASGKLPATTAVIASKAAADIYKLKILKASIQDLKENSTTFITASPLTPDTH